MPESQYSPMHAPRKEVSEKRMQEILAKHTPKADAVTVIEQQRGTPEDTGGHRRVLQWEKISDYYMRSICGMYRCRKYFSGDVVNDTHAAFRYQLEKKVGDLWFYRFGPPFDTWVQARAAAEADAVKG